MAIGLGCIDIALQKGLAAVVGGNRICGCVSIQNII